jgi:hypothetical protein
MTTVLIQPAGPRDHAMNNEKFEQLRAALKAEGHDATVKIPMERRGAGQETVELAIYLGEAAAADGILQLVKRCLRGLRRPGPPDERRTVPIYGPNGDVLATVELEDEVEDGA